MEGGTVRIQPDGILGAMVASEGFRGNTTLVNGAGGCRSRAQIVLRDLVPEYREEDPRCCGSPFFSRQSRLPCTYLGSDDIVFGTGCKVSEGLDAVRSVKGGRTVLVDTLGASLLCTDYSRIPSEGTVICDADLASMSFHEGFDLMTESVLCSMDIDGPGTDGPSVNILGYNLSDLGWVQGREELTRLLLAMGVRVNAFVGCDCTDGEVATSGSSDLNVVVHPEYVIGTSRVYSDTFGTPALVPSMGAPVGYAATRSLLTEVADRLGVDPAPALGMVSADESLVLSRLMNCNKVVDSLRAKGFALEGDSSTVYPLMVWMHTVFRMVPRSVVLHDGAYLAEVVGFLDGIGAGDAMGSGDTGDCEVVFTDGVTAGHGVLMDPARSHVAIGMPYPGVVDLMRRCMVATSGCRYILDTMLNGIGRFGCGQPSNVDMR